MKHLFIGLDFGSDSVRALLTDECGNQLADCVHNYTRWGKGLYCDAAKGQFRQHPADYLEVLDETLPQLLRSSGVKPAQIIGKVVCLVIYKQLSQQTAKAVRRHCRNPAEKMWKHFP